MCRWYEEVGVDVWLGDWCRGRRCLLLVTSRRVRGDFRGQSVAMGRMEVTAVELQVQGVVGNGAVIPTTTTITVTTSFITLTASTTTFNR